MSAEGTEDRAVLTSAAKCFTNAKEPYAAAECWVRIGEYKKAKPLLDRNAPHSIVLALAEKSAVSSSMEALRFAAELYKTLGLHASQGDALLKAGDEAAAVVAYEKGIRPDDNGEEVQRKLVMAEYYEGRRNWAAAAVWFRAAHELHRAGMMHIADGENRIDPKKDALAVQLLDEAASEGDGPPPPLSSRRVLEVYLRMGQTDWLWESSMMGDETLVLTQKQIESVAQILHAKKELEALVKTLRMAIVFMDASTAHYHVQAVWRLLPEDDILTSAIALQVPEMEAFRTVFHESTKLGQPWGVGSSTAFAHLMFFVDDDGLKRYTRFVQSIAQQNAWELEKLICTYPDYLQGRDTASSSMWDAALLIFVLLRFRQIALILAHSDYGTWLTVTRLELVERAKKLLEVLSPEMLPVVVAVGFDAITEVLSNELVFVKKPGHLSKLKPNTTSSHKEILAAATHSLIQSAAHQTHGGAASKGRGSGPRDGGQPRPGPNDPNAAQSSRQSNQDGNSAGKGRNNKGRR